MRSNYMYVYSFSILNIWRKIKYILKEKNKTKNIKILFFFFYLFYFIEKKNFNFFSFFEKIQKI